MQPTAFYGNSSGYVQVNSGPVVPTTSYVTVPASALLNPGVAEKYKSQQSKGLGITLVVIGILAFILNIIGIAVEDAQSSIGHGFWCGIPVRGPT